MTDFQSPDFDELCNLLLPLGALNSPAELQGLLYGKLCGGESLAETRWLLDAVEFLDFTQAPDETVRIALSQLYQDAQSKLQQQTLGITLLLPDDETDIGDRLAALGQWCYGFLTGFGSAGIVNRDELSEEAEEILQDVAFIVQINTDADDSEHLESDYMEVTEYLRMAVVSLYLEFAPQADAPQTTGTLQSPPSSTIH